MFLRDKKQFEEYLKEQTELNCYFVPCENFDEVIILQDVYQSLINKTIPDKKIIYSVSVILRCGYDYEIDLLMTNYKGLDNAIYLSKINSEKGFITSSELKVNKDGILTCFCLNGGELEYPLPKNNKIIDLIYGIDYSEVDSFKKEFSEYKVVAWPSELEINNIENIVIEGV